MAIMRQPNGGETSKRQSVSFLIFKTESITQIWLKIRRSSL